MHLTGFVSVFALLSSVSVSGLLVPRAAPQCSNQLKNPSPGGLVCEKRGYVRRPNVIATAKIRGQSQCRDLCIGNENCLSYSYAANNQSCTHYRMGILNSGFVRTTNGPVFANRRCYSRVCSCPTSQMLCGSDCADLSTDPNNCGACGTICQAPSAECRGSECACPSDGGQTVCGDTCTDLSSDHDNCGDCGNECSDTQACKQGTCQCPDGQDQCEVFQIRRCVDTSISDARCGGCNRPPCLDESSCVNSQCRPYYYLEAHERQTFKPVGFVSSAIQTDHNAITTVSTDMSARHRFVLDDQQRLIDVDTSKVWYLAKDRNSPSLNFYPEGYEDSVIYATCRIGGEDLADIQLFCTYGSSEPYVFQAVQAQSGFDNLQAYPKSSPGTGSGPEGPGPILALYALR